MSALGGRWQQHEQYHLIPHHYCIITEQNSEIKLHFERKISNIERVKVRQGGRERAYSLAISIDK